MAENRKPSTSGGSVAQVAEPAGELITIVGVRLTQGDAVNCPTIRDDAGEIHPVSYLSPAVAIGERVLVRGFYAVTTKCLGTVLAVEEEILQ